MLVLFLVLFFLFAPASQVHRAKSIVDLSDPTNHSRLVMWSTGLKIFADHPFWASAIPTFTKSMAQYQISGRRGTGRASS